MTDLSPSVFFAPQGPRVLAHRGLATDAPENTLLAFLTALSAGATHLETDVHASLDGGAVISHDPDLARLGRNVRIDQLTVTELKRVTLGSGQCVPSLAEVLDAFPEALFNIDVKSEAAVVPTAQAIVQAGATPRVLITSFSESRRRRTVDLLPGVATSASSAGVVKALLATALAPRDVLRRVLAGISAVQVPEKAGGVRIVTHRFVRAMHSIGVEVHVWTVNEFADMERLLSLGVDGLVTDRTDLAVEAISRRT